MMIGQSSSVENRSASLDGLRGMSARIVVLHHSLLTLPWFADRVNLGLLGQKNHFTVSVQNVFEYTPLHFFYGGAEAVSIFFALSGYLLVKSVSRDSISLYVTYRLVRLYTPIFISVTLASGLVFLFPRKSLTGGSWWINSHAIKFTANSFFKNVWVLDGNDWLNSSLWTMRYEIIFSFVVVVFARFTFRKSITTFVLALALLSCCVFVGIGYGFDLLGWLPIFFAGIALHWIPEDRFRFLLVRFFCGIFILFTPWYFAGFGYTLSSATGRVLMMIGAAMVVDVCRQRFNLISNFLSKSVPAFVGRYSYSLYLIHAPILTTVWFVMGVPADHIKWLLRFAISIFCIVIGTAVVYHLAEKPSLKFIDKHKNSSFMKSRSD